MKNKFANKILINFIFLAIFIVGIIFATIFDLQISHSLNALEGGKYLSNNLFGRFFESVGEMPLYILLSFSLSVLFIFLKESFAETKNKYFILALKAACVSVMLILNIIAVNKLIGYLSSHFSFSSKGFVFILISLVGGVTFSALWYFLTKKLVNKNFKRLIIFSLIVIFTAAFSQLIVQSIKPLFGRARYRLLYVENDFSEFTNWYVINGARKVNEAQFKLGAFSDGYKSFPSGHTAAASILFCLNSLPLFFKSLNTKKIKACIFMASLGYVFLVALSRIVMGAHYLSDVLIASGVSFLFYKVSEIVLCKKLPMFFENESLEEK